MTIQYICKLKSYIQPFEKTLALKELETITGNRPIPVIKDDIHSYNYKVNTKQSIDKLLSRLTYWEYIAPANDLTPKRLTLQVKLEATTNIVRNGITIEQIKNQLPFNESAPLHNRRALRYASHGIHEYRGKFFPQLVKSFLNIANASDKAKILDPMCGSGTTLVETSLLGASAYGIDQNPLSVFISNTKCSSLKLSPHKLILDYESLKADLLNFPTYKSVELIWFNKLNQHDQKYLKDWFAPEVLQQLDLIIKLIEKVNFVKTRDLFKVCFSNIIRKVSWQKNDDLRVRKEIRNDIDIDVIADFLSELSRTVRTLLAFLYENKGNKVGESSVFEGDARFGDKVFPNLVGNTDLIITSPPYATALPYLDTDRLSLYYLGLMERSTHRGKDYIMIGNREISNTLRKCYIDEYASSKKTLTKEINKVIDKIHFLNENSDAGFRRKNLSALLAHYFLDMRKVLESNKRLLKKGAYSFFVVGNNHTIANGERIDINTDELLAQLGMKVGLKVHDIISMEMLTSRDIFKKNTGNTEKIIMFRNL